jgi:glutamyl-tRNA synthetase
MVIKTTPTYRFAPSPTGVLHVGGARTAIFNWLLARQNKGKLLLRLEDTDRQRSTQESIEQILSSLAWLGIDWDEEPLRQSRQLERHKDIVAELLNNGSAYPCFCTKEELDLKRKQIQKDKGSYQYDRTCRSLTEEQIKINKEKGLPFTVRIKINPGVTHFHDSVHGDIETPNTEVDDFIIMRADQTPVYQIAVVIDDHDMGVTHVIRGDDHLANTVKQIQIYQSLDWSIPQFAHLPLILGPDRERLSKRHGAASVEEFRENGILPDALFNFLCLLGWAPGDDTELMSRDELIRRFTLDRVNTANAVFDFQKLLWMNGQYLNRGDAANLVSDLPITDLEHIESFTDQKKQQLYQLIDLVKQRVRSITDLSDGIQFFLHRPQEYDQAGVQKHFSPESGQRLSELIKQIKELPDFTAEAIEDVLRHMAEKSGIKAGILIHPIRLSLTGRTASPGIFDVMTLLGREEVIIRIENGIRYLNTMQKGDSGEN